MSSSESYLKIVIVGHVDHGKSTFIGRLFHDTGSLPEGKLEALKRAAARRGVPFEWANLMDSLQAERDQNITIDTAQIWFRTRKRNYVIIDAPGHREFLKNMVTGAASADAAFLVVDAVEGLQEQSARHAFLLHLLGLRQVVVLLNKMDQCNFDQQRFERVVDDLKRFMSQLGLHPREFIPISAKEGDNISGLSSRMPFWKGPTVIEALDAFTDQEARTGHALRMVVQDVYRFDHRRIIAGRVESGTLHVGDRLVFSPGNKSSVVKSIERWSAPAAHEAVAGESIGVTLEEQIFAERGVLASSEADVPYELTRLSARVFWMGRTPLQKDRKYKLKLCTQEAPCEVEAIRRVINASTLEVTAKDGEAEQVNRYEVADLTLKTRRPVAFDVFERFSVSGRFVIVDGFDLSGGGIILPDDYPHRTSDTLHKSTNIFWSEGKVSKEQRELLNGHPGCVVWLTGLSGSGKSTIASELEKELYLKGKHCYVLDGDKVRHGLCADLAFSADDRRENIRRIGEVAKLFADAGVIVITAFISPFCADREMVRGMLEPGKFVEVYVNAPLEVCEQRDVKGLYSKARAGEIQDFTGISSPYEPPKQPEIELRTGEMEPPEAVSRIIAHLGRL